MNQVLEQMAQMLEESWNRTDTKLRSDCLAFCEAHKGEKFDIGWGFQVGPYNKFTHGLSKREMNVIMNGAGWYEEQNKKAARTFVENLEARVKTITGEITEWGASSTEQSLSSYLVRGEKGAAKVSQIYAGGYNIVRLHIRNIVRKIA